MNVEFHKLDNASQVFFYEQDFYVLSNFSSFQLAWAGMEFPTSEHAYQWEKFRHPCERAETLRYQIRSARSGHEAFKLAEANPDYRRPGWSDMRVSVMARILRAKVAQHEYVRSKLLSSGNRELIEDSWRDGFWGWGPDRNGQNMLGKLWMGLRAELIAQEAIGGSK